MVIRQADRRNSHKSLAVPIDPSEAGQSPLSRRVTMIWLTGMLVLLPMANLKLPLNMTLVDVWILMALPMFWLSFARGSHIINLSYTIPMWFILVGSFASIFVAPDPRNSFIVILKEIYIFVWFLTLTAVLTRLNARDFRRVLVIWAAMVLLHGCVIVAQFLLPDFWWLMATFAGHSKYYEIYRPIGLFTNSNSAAFFQLLGFVPLILVSPSKKVAMILAVLLLITVLATGSMGAIVAFMVGLIISVIIILLSGRLIFLSKIVVQLAITIAILGGLLSFLVSQNERYHEHFERILLGRSERSSEGRFDLWQRGIDVFLEYNILLWGIGPENFRVVDERGKQLHNDFLAFSVERGLLSTLGLVLFAVLALGRAAYIVLIHYRYPQRAQLEVVVFLGATIAIIVESLTHQTFHFREMWLVLACQEAMLYKMMTSESGVKPILNPLSDLPGQRRGLVVQPGR